MDSSPTSARPRQSKAFAWPDAAPPDPAWPLIGRSALVADLVTDLLAAPVAGSPRTQVLSGLGGVGKTRLAAEVAREVRAPFDGRVAWLWLHEASREGGLASAIAADLGLAGVEPDHLADAFAETISDRPALLVLDGAESVLHDLGLLEDMLALAPTLGLLVTSRMAFERAGLTTTEVPGLDLPAADADTAAIAASPAVALLIDRGTRAGADVTLTDRTGPAQAAEHQFASLLLASRIEAKGIVAQAIDGIAGLVAAERPEEATTLWAAAETIRREARHHCLQADRRRIERALEAARATIPEEAWSSAWAAGERLSFEQAIGRARAAIEPSTSGLRAAAQVAV